MSHLSLVGRTILNNATQNGSDWDIQFDFSDLLGRFFATDVIVNDFYYFDASSYDVPTGTVRYKIKSIDSVVGSTITCTVTYDDEHPVEPDLSFLVSTKGVVCSPTLSGAGLTAHFAGQDMGSDLLTFDI